ncbi:MAG: hydantoinase/oxoprolinase family protein [Planctomycetota bacterium]
MATRIGIDTGGTFTDVVRWSRGGVEVHKLPSTPDDPGRAVLAGVAAARRTPDEPVDVVHGTTVGLNAVLQDRLPRTVFVTNRGFADLIEIGRQERAALYALEPDRPAPPVPRALRIEVDVRRSAAGRALQPWTDDALARAVQKVRRLRPDAVAIGLLHAPKAPADERRLAALLREALPDVPVTCSADLWPAFGEYERFSAAILNAAITPLVGSYTDRLNRELGAGALRLMRSSKGILPPREAAAFPARAMFSGPAGGVLATERLCARAGLPRAAAFDMGGTSTDVCLVRPARAGAVDAGSDQGAIAGLPLPLPTVDVHTVGCGGGSIAYCDAGGALRVGPQSAGAVPGPACYGRGDEATVTDAHVALGHLGPDTLLGGGFPIETDRSVRAIERLARRLGLSPLRTARGILEVADAAMARALMRVTGERAVDPATVPLVAYGGAGGLHAATLARRLGMPVALVPIHPGAFSALGLALAGESVERIESIRAPWSPSTERALRRRAARLAATAARELGVSATRARLSCRVRYAGQGGGLDLPLGRTALAPSFARAHAARFGFAAHDAPIELVHVTARIELPGPALPAAMGADSARVRRRGRRRAPVGGAHLPLLLRQELAIGAVVAGPCSVEETTATTLVPAGTRLRVTPWGLELR